MKFFLEEASFLEKLGSWSWNKLHQHPQFFLKLLFIGFKNSSFSLKLNQMKLNP